MKTAIEAAKWMLALAPWILFPILSGWTAVAWETPLALWMALSGLAARRRAPSPYGPPVWVCRLKLAWWAWRAEHR